MSRGESMSIAPKRRLVDRLLLGDGLRRSRAAAGRVRRAAAGHVRRIGFRLVTATTRLLVFCFSATTNEGDEARQDERPCVHDEHDVTHAR
jgi:hypothetical protein